MGDTPKEFPHVKIIIDETITINVTREDMIKAMIEEGENSMIPPEQPTNEKLN